MAKVESKYTHELSQVLDALPLHGFTLRGTTRVCKLDPIVQTTGISQEAVTGSEAAVLES